MARIMFNSIVIRGAEFAIVLSPGSDYPTRTPEDPKVGPGSDKIVSPITSSRQLHFELVSTQSFANKVYFID